MAPDLPMLGQDLLVMLFVIALRVGVPLLVLFVVGVWLKKLFEPQKTSSEELELKNGAAVEKSEDVLARPFQWIQVRLSEQFTKHI